jgi:S-adenosylmethionine:tRNA ribosyltransferase-isomerase
MRTDDFDFHLPAGSIAQAAIEPRHESRVLIASNLTEIRFRDIAELMEADDLLVVNRTKVRSARLNGNRQPTGGRTEVLLTRRIDPERWQALIKPSKKVTVGTTVTCEGLDVEILSDPVNGVATVAITCDGDVESAIAAAGTVPLPPYYKGELDTPDRYQTMFARTIGSSAAPTAALHFTEDVVESLRRKEIRIAEIDLEVGLDTFRPMGDGAVGDHIIHSERVVVDPATVAAVDQARTDGGKVIAVGTTVVRALETAAAGDGRIRAIDIDADLFIMPGYEFKVVDAIVTNFHAPRTTLILMIAAALGERWRDAYDHAIANGYRFLSFGDAMYIEITQ